MIADIWSLGIFGMGAPTGDCNSDSIASITDSKVSRDDSWESMLKWVRLGGKTCAYITYSQCGDGLVVYRGFSRSEVHGTVWSAYMFSLFVAMVWAIDSLSNL